MIDWLIDCPMEIFCTVTVAVFFIFYGLYDDSFIPRVGPNTSYWLKEYDDSFIPRVGPNASYWLKEYDDSFIPRVGPNASYWLTECTCVNDVVGALQITDDDDDYENAANVWQHQLKQYFIKNYIIIVQCRNWIKLYIKLEIEKYIHIH